MVVLACSVEHTAKCQNIIALNNQNFVMQTSYAEWHKTSFVR